MKSKVARDTGLALVLLVLLGLGYALAPRWLPETEMTLPPQTCDLNRVDCEASLPGGGQVRLGLRPQPVPLLEPIRVEVVVHGIGAERVELDFAGADMDMGPNRVSLKSEGDNRFAGTATLPVCVSGRMRWQVAVLFSAGRQRVGVPFMFETAR